MGDENGKYADATPSVRTGQPRKINCLSAAESYRLTQYIDTQRDRIIRDKMTVAALAEECQNKLKFRVTEGNVRFACRTVKVHVVRTNQTTGGMQNRLRIEALEKQVKELAASFQAEPNPDAELVKRVRELERALADQVRRANLLEENAKKLQTLFIQLTTRTKNLENDLAPILPPRPSALPTSNNPSAASH